MEISMVEPSTPSSDKKKKRMRVAVGFTGVAAVAAATLGPTTEAHAAPIPPSPYWVDVAITKNVSAVQVCGYRSPAPGTWACTPIMSNSRFGKSENLIGNATKWEDGAFNVWMWDAGHEYKHTCNTAKSSTWTGSVAPTLGEGPYYMTTFTRGDGTNLGRSSTNC
jgi:hypothetical protein